jgi:hypothetical protein
MTHCYQAALSDMIALAAMLLMHHSKCEEGDLLHDVGPQQYYSVIVKEYFYSQMLIPTHASAEKVVACYR